VDEDALALVDGLGQTLGRAAHITHQFRLMQILQATGEPALRSGGALRDVAPTLLYLLGLPAPPEMTGRPLVQLA